MAGKIRDFQKAIVDDADWKETIAGDNVFIEIHQSWCGPCECVKPMLYRIALDKEELKFCTAAADKIQALKDYKDKIKPVFLYYKKSQKKKEIEGVNAPEIQKLCENI